MESTLGGMVHACVGTHLYASSTGVVPTCCTSLAEVLVDGKYVIAPDSPRCWTWTDPLGRQNARSAFPQTSSRGPPANHTEEIGATGWRPAESDWRGGEGRGKGSPSPWAHLLIGMYAAAPGKGGHPKSPGPLVGTSMVLWVAIRWLVCVQGYA